MLDALHGYLLLAQALHAEPGDFATSWNFGPPDDASWTVAEVADAALRQLGYGTWRAAEQAYRHETASSAAVRQPRPPAPGLDAPAGHRARRGLDGRGLP